MQLHGKGRVSVGRFTMANLIATDVTSTVELTAGTVSLKELSADLLGGHHSGNWDIDFTASPPKYFGSGSVSKVAMAQVAALMHDPWATGTLGGQYTLGSSGSNAQGLRSSASGSAAFKWTGGSLRHMTLEGQVAPLTFASFEGNIALQNGNLQCQDCKLKTVGAIYSVSGTSGLDRSLALRLERASGPSYVVSGPLDDPHIETVSAPPAQAKLQ